MARKNKITFIFRNPRSLILSALVLLFSFSVINGQKAKSDQFPYDQEPAGDTPAFRERLFFGGSFGLSFGSITDIQLSPVVGFWALPRIAIAAGPTYRYYKDQIDKTALYGGRAYMQFVVIQDLGSVLSLGVHTGIFLHVEDELLSLKTTFWKNPPPYPEADRFYVNTVLAGIGLSQQIGKRSSLNFMILWPLNDSSYGIYSKPDIKISFIF
jgi:hypothetical protein